jgi:hypothetical protein
MSQTVAVEVPEFLQGFARIHNAMRRDAQRLPEAIAATGNDTAAVLGWYRCFRAALETHHQREDTILWPELLRRDPSFADANFVLAKDHHELDIALEAVELTLQGDGDAAAAARRLGDVLVDHLAREEAAAFPRIAACFTAAEYEQIERGFLKGTSLRHLAFEVPWVLDGLSEAEFAEVKASAPRALVLLHRFVFAPRYAKTAAPLLAVAR